MLQEWEEWRYRSGITVCEEAECTEIDEKIMVSLEDEEIQGELEEKGEPDKEAEKEVYEVWCSRICG